jgi:UDP-N-acetylglucosamine 3-dehydrogenase
MVGIVIIGCGDVSKQRHAPLSHKNEKVDLIGFYNRTIAKAEAFQKKYGGKVYRTLEEIWDDGTVDAVIVATNEQSHSPITIAALEAGKHVLCEKPMADSVAEAERMQQVAEKTGKKLMIIHNQRLYPAHQLLKKVLAEGTLGKVHAYRTTLANQGQENDGWGTAFPDFYDRIGHTNGALAQVGVHRIDLLNHLFSEDPVIAVLAHTMTQAKQLEDGSPVPYEDYTVLQLQHRSGSQGTLLTHWFDYSNERQTVIYGEKATAITYADGHPVALYRKNGEKTYLDDPSQDGLYAEPLTPIVDKFVESIEEDTVPFVTAEQGITALRILAAAYRSQATQTWTPIEQEDAHYDRKI